MESDAERLLAVESAYPWYCASTDRVSAEEQSSSSAVHRRSSASKSRWPWFLWFVIKFIGLFNRRPAVTKKRLCMQCRLAAAERRCVIKREGVPGYLYPGALLSDGEEEGIGEDEMTPGVDWSGLNEARLTYNGDIGSQNVELRMAVRDEPSCDICRSEWWNAYGTHEPYDSREIGIKKWNHWGSTFVSVLWQLLLVLLNLIQFLFYFFEYWGQEDRVVDLVIYSGFVVFVASVPTLCLIANIINVMSSWQKKPGRYSWYSSLDIRYIVKRLQHLKLREHGLPYKAFLIVCFVWPSINSSWRMYTYYYGLRDEENSTEIYNSSYANMSVEASMAKHHRVPLAVMIISLAVCSLSMCVWGAFCYLVAVMRLSFQRQLDIELAFLRKHVNDLDRCRRRLTSCMEVFGSLASLTTFWVMFTIAVTAWAITTQVYFDYAVENKANKTGEVKGDIKFATSTTLDGLIWSQIAMFLLLPLIAVGGLNLNGLWVSFTRSISEMRLGDASRDKFCDEILAYCTDHPPVQNIETVTLFVSALGLCLAVEFNERDEFGF